MLVSENVYTRPTELVRKRLMRLWIIILIIGIAGTAFGRLGDTEKQLTKRYGKPTSVRPGGKFNPYFDKWLDFQTQGVDYFLRPSRRQMRDDSVQPGERL